MEWIIAIIRSPVVGHLWYLYTLIAAYFFIPVLSAFFKTTDLRLQTLILIIWFIAASGIPFLNRYFNDAKFGIDIHFFYIYPAYMLAGALLYTHCTMNLRRFLACAAVWALSTAGTAFFTWHFSKDAQVNTELYYEYFAPLVVTGALALFCTLRYLGRVIAAALHQGAQRHRIHGRAEFRRLSDSPDDHLGVRKPRIWLELHQPLDGHPLADDWGCTDLRADYLHHQENPGATGYRAGLIQPKRYAVACSTAYCFAAATQRPFLTTWLPWYWDIRAV